MSDSPPTDSAVDLVTPSPLRSVLATVGPGAVWAALVVFLLNMGGAWFIAVRAVDTVSAPLVGAEITATSRALDGVAAGTTTANGFTLLNRVVDADLQIRAVQNRQALAIVGMAAAFAMMAVGFALFVMGADGAFELAANSTAAGDVVLKSTAPGILCFLLATVMLVFSIRGEVNMATGAFQVLPDAPTPAPVPEAAEPALVGEPTIPL